MNGSLAFFSLIVSLTLLNADHLPQNEETICAEEALDDSSLLQTLVTQVANVSSVKRTLKSSTGRPDLGQVLLAVVLMLVLAGAVLVIMMMFKPRERVALSRPDHDDRCLGWGLPVLILADLCLLVASHVLIGVTTHIDGVAPLNQLQPHVVTSDNLLHAVQRLAQAGAWLMVVVVALLSGLWPYLKLLGTLLTMWMVRHCRISRAVGRYRLQVLETLGTWSFADVFLICFNLVIFNIDTPLYHLTAGDLQVKLWMQLQFGAFGLIVAIIFSTLLTHWTLNELQKLEEIQPSAKDRQEIENLVSRRAPWSVHVIAGLVFMSLCLLVLGCVLPMMRVDRAGFLGALIGPGKDLDLSVIGLVRQVGVSSAFFAIALLFLAVVAPILELLLLMASVARESDGKSRQCLDGAEWFNSFTCTEILLIVGLITVVELPTVVQFNLGDECAAFQPLMNNGPLLTLAGIGFAKSSECFAPTSSIQIGWWILLASSLLRIAASMMWRRAHSPWAF